MKRLWLERCGFEGQFVTWLNSPNIHPRSLERAQEEGRSCSATSDEERARDKLTVFLVRRYLLLLSILVFLRTSRTKAIPSHLFLLTNILILV
jgi:hypothetical protein